MTAKILVVDDEPAMSQLVERQFRKQIRDGKFAFLFANDGHEAMMTLRTELGIDMVITDINMPNMDGLTLLGRLHEIDPLLRTIIVSAYGDMDNIRTAMNRGAFDFITKPVNFQDLEITIEKTLAEVTAVRDTHRRRATAERERALLGRYFSPSLLETLVNDPDRLTLGLERRELSFLFTDLTGFTTLVERTEPRVILHILNEYLDGMVRIAFDCGATIDKIVGDSIHAMFGAPTQQVDHAARAVRCALKMDAFAQEFAIRKRRDGTPLGETRIGVNTGSAIVGCFGTELLIDYTAHGDAVNTTERLEKANKRLGTRICVSATTTSNVAEFAGRPVGRLRLKGRSTPVDVYEPLSKIAAETKANLAYVEAFRMLGTDDAGAEDKFAQIARDNSNEVPLAVLHLRRLRRGETGTIIDLSS